MAQVKSRDEFLFGNNVKTMACKEDLAKNYVMLMINRCIQMFEYDNLPDTITTKDMEYLIQNIGYCCFTKVDDKYYVFDCSLGGVPNEYYLPTRAIVANPYLKFNKQLVIDKDCVVIKNTSTYTPLLDLHKKYAYLLAEVDISLKYATWHSREVNLIVAETDSSKKDAENLLNKIVDGEELGVIGGRQGLNNISTYPYSQGNDSTINSLLELRQYLYATWFIDLGINANFNMKRESLNANEVEVNEYALLPLIDDMLNVRKQAVEKINKLYDLNISVKLNSSWNKIQNSIETEEKQNELNTDILQAQVEQVEEVEDETKRDEQSNDSEQITSNEQV